MPENCRQIIAKGKASGNISLAREKVGLLSQADNDRRLVIDELLSLIDIATSPAPKINNIWSIQQAMNKYKI